MYKIQQHFFLLVTFRNKYPTHKGDQNYKIPRNKFNKEYTKSR